MTGVADSLPRNIRRFEALQIITTIVGLVHQLMLHPEAYLIGVGSSAIILGLTFLISRRHKKWPRWILVGLYVLGTLVTGYVLLNGELAFSRVSLLIVAGLTILQAVALAFAFTRQASDWLNRRPA